MTERHGDNWFFRLKNYTKAQALSGGPINSMARVVERSAKVLFLVSSGIHHHGNADSEAHDSRRFGFHSFPFLFSVKTKRENYSTCCSIGYVNENLLVGRVRKLSVTGE